MTNSQQHKPSLSEISETESTDNVSAYIKRFIAFIRDGNTQNKFIAETTHHFLNNLLPPPAGCYGVELLDWYYRIFAFYQITKPVHIGTRSCRIKWSARNILSYGSSRKAPGPCLCCNKRCDVVTVNQPTSTFSTAFQSGLYFLWNSPFKAQWLLRICSPHFNITKKSTPFPHILVCLVLPHVISDLRRGSGW